MTQSQLDVLFITRKWAPAVGGMETWSIEISDALRSLTDIDVIALPGQPDGSPPRAASLLGFPIKVIKRLIARKSKADILHLGDMAIWPIAMLGGHKGRVIISAHGTDASYARRKNLRGQVYRAYLKLGARLLRTATIAANSDATAQAVRETGWHKVDIIPLATTMRGHVQDTLPQRNLLFVGRIISLKGLSWFVANVLPHIDPDITLHVAGPPTDAEEAAALKHPRVKHLGTLSKPELAEAYRRALCVVVPNIVPNDGTFEGYGLVATEAAAAGGVVLGSRSGGIPAAILDNETGFLIRPEDAAAWTQTISTISGWSLEKRQSFVSSSLNKIDQCFRWNIAAQRTMATYQSTLPFSEI